MVWSLVRLTQSDDGRWWLAAGLFGGLALLSKYTAIFFAPAILVISAGAAMADAMAAQSVSVERR